MSAPAGPVARTAARSAGVLVAAVPATEPAGLPIGGVSRIARQVRQFHHSYELPVRSVPTAAIESEQVALRLSLIEEEVGELRAAALAGELTGIADALADIVYVAYGSAHIYGIDLDAVLDEVHSSNMTKLGADGRPVRRADGKVLKGPDYRSPDVAAVLAAQVPGTDPSGTTLAGSAGVTLEP